MEAITCSQYGQQLVLKQTHRVDVDVSVHQVT
jgi:hypothetical protein